MRRSPRLQPGVGGDGGSPPDAPAAGAAPLAPGLPASGAAAAAPCNAENRGRRCRVWALRDACVCPQRCQRLCAYSEVEAHVATAHSV
jgi:hypothetical protein